MKRSLLLVPILLVAMALPTTLTFTPESQLWISGTSSVHDWTCTVEAPEGTVELNYQDTDLAVVHAVSVTVPVRSIACKNRTMNKKTYKALQEKAHPTITFVLDIAHLTDQVIEATGQLTVAGVTHTVTVPTEYTPLGNGRFRFTGEVPLRMSDFNINPPKAMLGTLKTGNDVTVGFDIVAGS